MILKNSEKKENNRLQFQVESDEAEFSAALKTAYNKNKGKINVPGFRRGKAPQSVIEGMYGKEVFYTDALDEMAQAAFDAGIDAADVDFIGAPVIVNADVQDGKGLITFMVELYPEVELGQYKGIEVTKADETVTDADVDAEIASVQKRNARKVTVDDRAAEMGDTCNIDFEGFLDAEKTNPFEGGKAEGHDLELGSNSFVPGFEEQVVGMTVGETKDINITFPENYKEDLAGKAVVFTVKLNAITKSELPALDDDFAQDVSEFDTFDAYKADVLKTLQERKHNQAESAMKNEAILKACDNMKVEVPETMIRNGVENMIRNFASNYGMNDPKMPIDQLAQKLGLDANTINNAIRPNAIQETKVDILVKAITKAESIEPTEEQMNAYVEEVASQVGATAEEVKKHFPADYIKDECARKAAIAVVTDSIVVVDAPAAAEATEEKAE